jgi:hypothetical protein
MRTWTWMFVGALMLAAGFASAVFLGVSDVLPDDIHAALTRAAEAQDSGTFVIIHRAPTGVGRGMQISLFLLLLGGIPSAIAGSVLVAASRRRARPWAEGWQTFFTAGFLFQSGSVAFSGFLLGLLLYAAYSSEFPELAWFAAALLLNASVGLFGIRAWHTLQLQTRMSFLTVTSR